MAPSSICGIAEERLQAVHRRRVGHVDVAEAVLEGGGVGLEAGDVAAEQVVEAAPHVGDAQHGVDGDLLEADPEAQVVGGDAPLAAELVEVGRHDHQLVGGRAGDGQVVLAERAAGEVADHGAGGHAQHHRPDHLQQRAHEPERVGGVGRDRRRRLAGVVAEGAGEALEERSPGVEGGVGPLAAGDRHDADALAAGGGGQSGHGGRRAARPPGPAARCGCAPAGRRWARPPPSVATDRASWRAASQPTGPCCWKQPGQVAEDRHPLEGVSGGLVARRHVGRFGAHEFRLGPTFALAASVASGSRRPPDGPGMIPPMGEIVVVTGADGAVGRRVVGLFLDEPGVERVVAVGPGPRRPSRPAAVAAVRSSWWRRRSASTIPAWRR